MTSQLVCTERKYTLFLEARFSIYMNSYNSITFCWAKILSSSWGIGPWLTNP